MKNYTISKYKSKQIFWTILHTNKTTKWKLLSIANVLSTKIGIQMTLLFEPVISGKPHMVLGKHKIRESYTLKSGKILWRCLDRNCKASIKPDAEWTDLILANNTQSDPHPITRRSMSSPQPMSTPKTRASTSKTAAELNESTSSSLRTFFLSSHTTPGQRSWLHPRQTPR